MKVDMSAYIAELSTKLGGSVEGLDKPENDARVRALLNRVKNARISGPMRDSVTAMVKNLAENDRLDYDAARKITELISFIETTEGGGRRILPRPANAEKSVDDEMKEIYTARAEKKAQAEKLDSLRSTFSKNA